VKHIRWLVILFVILGALTTTTVFAQIFPQPSGHINDFANLLTPPVEKVLENELVKLERDTTAEVAVVTIISLENEPLDMYSNELFNYWSIGKKAKDNGVLFLIVLSERQTRIEVGYGLEPVITDGRAGRILDKDVIPSFKEGDYEKGIQAGVRAIESYIREGTPPSFPEDNPLQNWLNKEGFVIPTAIVLGIITIYLAGFMARSKSIWLGGIWGFVCGVIVGLIWGKLVSLIALPICLTALGLLLDWWLSRNYKANRTSGHSTSWTQTFGGFSSSYRGGGSSFGGFGGGHSGGGGAGRGW
jgi:uncharacterized protein